MRFFRVLRVVGRSGGGGGGGGVMGLVEDERWWWLRLEWKKKGVGLGLGLGLGFGGGGRKVKDGGGGGGKRVRGFMGSQLLSSLVQYFCVFVSASGSIFFFVFQITQGKWEKIKES